MASLRAAHKNAASESPTAARNAATPAMLGGAPSAGSLASPNAAPAGTLCFSPAAPPAEDDVFSLLAPANDFVAPAVTPPAVTSQSGLNVAAEVFVPRSPIADIGAVIVEEMVGAGVDVSRAPMPAVCNELLRQAAAAGLAIQLDVPARPNTNPGYDMFNLADSPAARSPLRPEAWSGLLAGYPDPNYAANIRGIIAHGARLGYSGPLRGASRPAAGVKNLPMTERDADHVRQTIGDRVRLGLARVAAEGEKVICSPIGTVPKSNGKLRTINHLSWPRNRGDSVNGGIPIESVYMKYELLDGLFEEMRGSASDNLCLWKADLKDAYYHVVLSSADCHLMGFHFEGATYVDCTLNFGGRSSPFIFNYFAEALHRILQTYGIRVHHYLDDFFGVAPKWQVLGIVTFVRSVCRALGLQLSDAKTTTGVEMEILGIQVNAMVFRAWITEARKKDLTAHLASLTRHGAFAEFNEVHSLVGKLLFVSKVCPTGRAFLRRVYDWLALHKNTHGGTLVAVLGEVLDDLKWWKKLFETWNGVLILRHSAGTEEIWMDAATSGGLGGHLGPRETCVDAFCRRLFANEARQDIMVLEGVAVVEALRRWRARLRNHTVVLKIDNAVLVAAIRSGSVRHKPLQKHIREVFMLAMEYNLTLAPQWVASEENVVADALSRFDPRPLAASYPHVLGLVTFPRHAPSVDPSPATLTPDVGVDDTIEPEWYRTVGGDRLEATYLWFGLASSTRSTYSTVVDSFVNFGRLRGWSRPLFPAPAERVGVWIAHKAHRVIRSGRRLYAKTLKTKVYGLLSWHKDLGLDTGGVVSPRVERVIAGANRLHGLSVKEQPLPITLPVLRKVVRAIRTSPDAFGGRVGSLALVAAFTLGFACFMRMGELTYTTFDGEFDLRRSDVTLRPEGEASLVFISASKTDPFRKGVTTTIPPGPADICPIAALRRYLDAAGDQPTDGPLFTLQRRPFTRARVVGFLEKALREAGYPAERFSGHLLRRGAATWASSVGMSATEIKTLGRWNSDAFKLYVDAGPANHVATGRRMLSARACDSTLDPSGIPRPGQVWRPAL